MKYLFLTLFFFSCKASKEIPSPPKYEENIECENSNKQAELDYKNGKKNYIILGLVEAGKFEMFYFEYMKLNYNIIVKANCTPKITDECYANTMLYEIEKEYGEKFIENTLIKARKEFKKVNK